MGKTNSEYRQNLTVDKKQIYKERYKNKYMIHLQENIKKRRKIIMKDTEINKKKLSFSRPGRMAGWLWNLRPRRKPADSDTA
jgi:hypothetical protein